MSQTYIVPEGVRRQRADKVLAAAFKEQSRAAWQRAFAAGLVSREGRAIDSSDSVSTGDVLAYSFPDTRPAELRAVSIPLDVLYEDEHLLAVNKAAGMVVHPGAATGEDTLVHALLAHCAGSLSGIGGVERPGIVHRLDRETSGVILVAKNDAAHRGLASQFSGRSLDKQYLALVTGVPALRSGSTREPIGRNPQHRHKMGVVPVDEGGRDARTDWEVVESFGTIAALLRCTIYTGRTHQIRVHLKELGHVILGDDVYGWKKDARLKVQPERVMLHAEHLVFTHPVTGRPLDLTAPLPPDFVAQMKQLRAAARTEVKSAQASATERVRQTKPSYHRVEKRD
jgi:23S rRNA pseudouridine1911/1915/1917 synthase